MTRLIAILLVSGVAAPAAADVEDELGLGPVPAAMAGAVTAVPVGHASAYYAPAMVSASDDEPGFAELALGFVFARPAVYVDGVDGADIALAVEPRTTASLYVGTRFDLGHAFGVRGLSAALSLYSPVTKIFTYSIHPDDSVQWLTLTDRTQHLGLHAALALRIAPWLSVGGGVRVLFDLETYTSGNVTGVSTVVDPTTGAEMINADTRLGESVRVYGRVAPTLSVASRPIEALELAATWRGELLVDDWGWARTSATAGLPALGYLYRFVHYYRPHELAFGAALRLGEALTLCADATVGLWGDSPTKNFERLPGRFGHTVTPAVGARARLSEGVGVMAGYQYSPSVFDNFGGPTNLLDNDRHVGAIGGELDLGVLTDGAATVVARASFRLAWLVERQERKDFRRFDSDRALERNPGHPGYDHGGFVPSAQLELEAAW